MPQLLPPLLISRRPGLIHPSLENVRIAAGRLGNPQAAFASARIAGTNGKGSTAAMLAALLDAHGLRTGLYTSPHLVRVEERIQIAGEPIATADLERILERLEPERELSFFETLTLAAFVAFAEADIDVAVLEVGLGGRWDATTVAPSSVAGLTNIGTDHSQWLGATRSEIAREKAAALDGAEIAVLGPQVETGLITGVTARRLIRAADLAGSTPSAAGLVDVRWGDGFLTVPLPLPGVHQAANLHLALALASALAETGVTLPLQRQAVRRGLEAVSWPGRLSRHRLAGREVILDGAHNLEAAGALAAHLAATGTRHDLLFSCLEDKPVEAMARSLGPLADRVAVFPLDDPRAAPLERLAAAFPGARRAPSAAAGLDLLGDPVLATGSLRVVGELLQYGGEEP